MFIAGEKQLHYYSSMEWSNKVQIAWTSFHYHSKSVSLLSFAGCTRQYISYLLILLITSRKYRNEFKIELSAQNKLSDLPQIIQNLLPCANCSFLSYYNRFFISFELITLNCVVDKLTVYWCVWLWKVFATLKKHEL